MVAGAWENDAKFQQERSMIDQKMDREDTQLGYRLGIEERIADKRIAADNAQLGARIASSEKEGALDRANRLEAIRLSMQGRKDLAEMNNAAKLQQIKNRASGGKAPTLRQAEGSETDIMMNVMGYVNDIADDYNLNKVQKNKLVTQAVSLGINQWNKLNNMYHRGEIATPPDIPSVIARQIIDQGLQSNEVQNGNFFKSGKYTPSEAASATPKSDYPLRGTPKPQQSSSVQEDILRGIGAGPGLDAASERAQIREEFNSPKDQSTSSARFSESGLTLGRSKDEEVKKLLTPNQFKLYMEGSPEERKAVRKHFGLE